MFVFTFRKIHIQDLNWGVPTADREIIQLLKAKVATGAATFLIKVKAHRGEPLNNTRALMLCVGVREQLADTLAEEAREAAKEISRRP